jgi:hypothetical protein
MASLLSINSECSQTIPCTHECTIKDEQGQKKIRRLNAETIHDFLQKQPESWMEYRDHFEEPQLLKLEKITRFEIGPSCESGEVIGESCVHYCSFIYKGKEAKQRLLFSLIKKIVKERPSEIKENPWENDAAHFPQKKCCIIL